MPFTRIVGLLWVAYVGVAAAGETFAGVPGKLLADAIYFVVAIFVYRLFADVDPIGAFALLPLAAVGCVLQAIAQVRSDRDLQNAALVVFALFLFVIGYLVLRSAAVPHVLGIVLIVAGLGWCASMIPGTPLPLRAAIAGFGMVAEGSFALWLIFAG